MRYRAISFCDILESDVIHNSSRRADGRDLDWVFHANPAIKEKGTLVVFNPLNRQLAKMIRLNLYHTGLTDKATLIDRKGKTTTVELNRQYNIDVPVTVGPVGASWFVVE